RCGKAAGPGDRGEVDPLPGMACLHSGLAEMMVVDHHEGEIARLRNGDRGEAAEGHELLAVAGDDEDASSGLRLRQAEADEGGTTHGAPEIVVGVAGLGSSTYDL